MDPPIQMVGIPVQVQNGDSLEVDVQHIHFYALTAWEKLHYCTGLGYYIIKMTGLFSFRLAWFILSNSALLVRWTLGGVFNALGDLYYKLIRNDLHHSLLNEDSSEDYSED